MKKFKKLSAGIDSVISPFPQLQEKALYEKRARNVKAMWKDVVDEVILDHTNSIYIKKEEDKKILIVYVDESIISAELKAQQELIKIKLARKFGEYIDEFKVLISRGRYKNNYPFRNREKESYVERVENKPLTPQQLKDISIRLEKIDNPELKEAMKNAVLSDLAWKNGISSKKSN